MLRYLTFALTFTVATSTFAAPSPTTAKGKATNPDAVFKRADTNGDGKLSREEFKAFIVKASKGKAGDNPTRLDKLFDRLDANGDGFLSLAEFQKLKELREQAIEKRKEKTATKP